MAKRTAITATGTALLALIANSTDPAPGVMYLTQNEASEAINAGHASVDTNDTKDNTAAVSLTDAGRAALASVNGQGTDAVASGNASSGRFEIEDYVPSIPLKPTRGRGGGYPFDGLNVNQSFHVPPKVVDGKTETGAEVAARLASTVSGARMKYAEQDGDKTKVVKVSVYAVDGDGKPVKGADGKRVVTGTREETRPVMKTVRDFTVVPVGADDPKGIGARVVRTA